jgi:hypothetical protein
VVRALAEREAPAERLTDAEAADIVYTLMSPEVYRILTLQRGWSPDRYEEWLATALRPGARHGFGGFTETMNSTRSSEELRYRCGWRESKVMASPASTVRGAPSISAIRVPETTKAHSSDG